MTNYAGAEDAPDHTTQDKTDSASVIISSPEFAKEFVSTEINNPAEGNDNDEAVIGEYVTYRLTVTIPEGETLNAQIVDRMSPGLAFVDILSVTSSADLTLGNAISTGANPTNVTVGNSSGGTGNQITVNLGDVQNANTDNGVSETIVIEYRAVVINTNTVPAAPGNQSGSDLNNSADFSWDYNDDPDPDAGAPEGSGLINSSAALVTVIEPVLSVDTQVSSDGTTYNNSLSGVDADQDIFYRIQVTNSVGGATAFDIDLSDAFDSSVDNLTIASVTLTNAAGGGGGSISITDGGAPDTLSLDDFVLTGDNTLGYTLSVAGGRNIDLAGDSRLEIILSGAVLDYDVQPNTTLNNDTEISWTSLDGLPGARSVHNGNSTERTGLGGEGSDGAVLNNYADSDVAPITIQNVDVVKSIVQTSEAHTTGNSVAIGEIVRYRIVVDLPEGATTDFQVRDLLPNGLIFLDDGTATAGFVSNGDAVTSSTLTAPSLDLGNTVSSPTFVLPDGAVSSSSGSDNDTYNRGTDMYFKLGNLSNSASDAFVEQVVIEFNVLVHNNSGDRNDRGETVNNRARAINDGADLDTSPNVGVTIVEPTITTVKSITSTGPYDGSTAIEYTVTFTNLSSGSNRSTAFDVVMQDNLPTFLGSVNIVSVTPSGVVTGLASSVAGNLVEVTADSIAVGASVTVVYQANVTTTVPAGQSVDNTATVNWTSLPGTGTAGNATGSDTPGASGDNDGERDGSDGIGINPNDYRSNDSESFVVPAPSIEKLFRDGTFDDGDTSLATTTGQNLVIGESVTYDILVTLPEGTTQDLVVRDIVPEGLRVDSVELILTQGTNAGESGALAGGWGGVGSTDLVANSPTITATPFNGSGDLELDFGDVSVSSDNDGTNNSFVVRIVATAINVASNQNAVVLTNSASYTYDDPVNGTTTIVEADDTDTEVTIREADLQVVKAITSDTANLDAGDIITYQITVSHTGASSEDAFDIILNDTMPAELENLSFVSAEIGVGNDVSGLFNFDAGTGVLSTTGDVDLLLTGDDLVITLSGTILDTTAVESTISNTATVLWSSVDGGLDGDDAGAIDERTGSDGSAGSPNNYATSGTTDIDTVGVLNVAKIADKAEATIGEVITYTVTVEVAQGTTNNIVLTDTLPTGTTLVGAAVLSNPNGLSITGFNTASASQTLTQVVAPNATNAAGVLETSTFSYTYQVRVDNVASNDGISAAGDGDGQTVLTNDLDASADDLPDDDDNQASTTVIEPLLQIDQIITTDTTGLDAGDTVTYQITVDHAAGSTSDAYELVIGNEFPVDLDGLNLDSVTINGVAAPGLLDLTGRTLSTTSVFDLADGDTLVITVTGVIGEDTDVGQTLTSTPTLVWTNVDGGLSGDDAGTVDERTGSDGEGGNPNYYADSDSDDIATNGVLTVAKSAAPANAAIGETITYSITFEVAEGRTEVNWTDILPAGMAFVSNSVTLVSNPSSLSISGLNNNTLSGQVLTVQGATSGDQADTVETATFTLEYEAVVQNVATNDNGDVLTNTITTTADLNDDGDTGDGGETDNDTATVTVQEPVLAVNKTVLTADVSQLDAGDTVTYQIEVSHTGASTADAYELILSDTLPSELSSLNLVSAEIDGNPVGAGVFTLAGTSLTTTADLDLLNGETLTLVISGVVDNANVPGTIISNSATVAWSSQDAGQDGDEAGVADGVNDERTGSGVGSNDYTDTDSAPDLTTVGTLSVDKSSDVATAAIGDIVTYTVQVTVAEGTTTVNLADTLPAGMVFQTTSGVLTTPGGWTISGFNNNSLNQALTITNPGDVNGSGTLDSDSFSYTYQALVQNVAANDNGDVLTNALAAAADLNDDGDTTDLGETDDDTVDVTVIEPVLEIEKTILTADVSQLDAGDTFSYQIQVRHVAGTSTADAFDLILSDALPTELGSLTLVSAQIGATNVASSFGISGTNLTTTGNVDLLQAEVLTLVVSGQVLNSNVPGTLISNSATIDWSSQDGGQDGDESGVSDGTNDERTGSGIGSNDYTTTDAAPDANTVGTLAIAKSVDTATAAIGDIVTYTVQVTVAEGTTTVSLSDTLPAGTVFVPVSANLTTPGGWSISGFNTNSVNQTLTITNPGNDDAPNALDSDSFTYTYQALVRNVAGNQDAVMLTNSLTAVADLNNDGDTGDAGETVNDTATVEVVEADLEVIKTVVGDTSNLDAGDTITYQVTIRHTADSSAGAFELVIDDTMPPELENRSFVSAVIGASNVAGSFAFNAATGVLSTTGDVDLVLGQELVITLSGEVPDAAVPGTLIDNSASVAWSSQDGGRDGNQGGISDGSNDERTGSEIGVNDYTDTGDAPQLQTVGTLDISKVADLATASIGDIVTYTVSVTVAEGTTTVTLDDSLPVGTTFVASSANLNTPGGWTINGFNTNSVDQTLTITNPGAVDDSSALESGSFTFTYQARVDNVSSNQDGVDLTNNLIAVADLNNDGDTTDAGEEQTDDATVEVVEPVLNINQIVTTGTGGLDAGDTVTYQITVSHTAGSSADAYELILGNTFPVDLDSVTLSSALIGMTDVSGSFSIVGGVLTTPGDVDLAQGASLVLTVTGVIGEDTDVGQTLTSPPTLVWSSLDGGLDGDDVGTVTERTGSDGEGAGLNNYADSDSDDVVTNGVLSVAKVANLAEASVGDIVTYTVTFTVAEGRTEINWSDTLPAGTVLVANSVAVGSNPGSLSITGLNDNSLTGQSIVVQGTASGDDAATVEEETFTIEYQALVQNVAGNQDGTVLTNSFEATADLNDDGDEDDGGEEQTDDASVTVTEPVLEVSKSVVTDVTNVDAGDTVTYEIVVNHTGASTADAFEITLADNLPSELGTYTLDSALIGATDVSGSFSIVGGVLSTTGDVDLLETETLTIRISGIALDSNVPGTDIDNTVDLDWSSIDGGQRGDESGISDGVNDERTGTPGSGLDDYNDSDLAATVTTVGTLAISKTANVTTAAIGDTATYTVTVTVAEGTTTVSLADTLPAGMVFVTSSANLNTPAGWTISGFNTNNLNQTLTITNPGDVDASDALDSDSFTYTYQALVQNVGSNQDGTVLTNALTATADLNNDGDTNDGGESLSDDFDVTVVEPVLEVNKTVLTADVSQLDAGDKVRYQIVVNHTGASTADAFDVILADLLPTELSGFSLVSAEVDTTDVSPVFTLSGTNLTTTGNLDLLQGEVLTLVISGTIDDSTVPGAIISNSAEVDWSSQDGGQNGDQPGVSDGTNDERTGSGVGNNDYTDSDDAADLTTVGTLAVDKTADVVTAAIGDTVTYTVEVTVAEGTTTVGLVDTLPAGMVFVPASASLTTPGGWTISGFDTNDLNQSLTITNPGDVDGSGTLDSDSFTYTYQALVQNIAGNQDGTILSNSLAASADLNNDGDTDDAGETDSDTVPVTVIEPVLVVSKSVLTPDVSGLDAGDTLTYEIVINHTGASTADAFDVILSDTLESIPESWILPGWEIQIFYFLKNPAASFQIFD